MEIRREEAQDTRAADVIPVPGLVQGVGIEAVDGVDQMPMASPLPADPAAPSAARLLIHCEGDSAARGSNFKTLLLRLRALYAMGPQRDDRVPLRLRIIDLQGHEVLVLDDAGPLVDVNLRAGTYHVALQRGDVRRRYTITLSHGATFDLYLRLARGAA